MLDSERIANDKNSIKLWPLAAVAPELKLRIATTRNQGPVKSENKKQEYLQQALHFILGY
jgi:hypothetical protein